MVWRKRAEAAEVRAVGTQAAETPEAPPGWAVAPIRFTHLRAGRTLSTPNAQSIEHWSLRPRTFVLSKTLRTMKRRATEQLEILANARPAGSALPVKTEDSAPRPGDQQPRKRGRIPGNASRSHSGPGRERAGGELFISSPERCRPAAASDGTPVRFKIKPLARSRWPRGEQRSGCQRVLPGLSACP